MITLWILAFIASLAALILASDVFTQRSERIALAFGVSPFVIGITLVAFGTSVPELATGVLATLRDASSVAVANAIGSNIANILLVLGVAAVVARPTLKAERNLIDIDLPLFFISTVLMLLVVMDREVTLFEGFILILAYNVYIAYAYTSGTEKKEALAEAVETERKRPNIDLISIVLILVSIGVIYAAADWTVRSIVEIATFFQIPRSAIAITAIAIGTSLPELVISVRAALQGKHDLAIGNIMGSNIFNVLIIVGVPSLFGTLVVDDLIWMLGIPFLIVATLILIFSGITRRIYRFEGAMYLVVYLLFLFKIANFSA